MQFPRTAGILLHVTSLPSRFGIGDLGPEAYAFVDFLEASGQRLWQILPLGPPAEGNSPYSCFSAFAGNPLMISPELLVQAGLLDAINLPPNPLDENPAQVDFETVNRAKQPLLETAFKRFQTTAESRYLERFHAFCNEQGWWLDDFVRFEALRHHFQSDDWTTWPPELVTREESARTHWDEKLAETIAFFKFTQFLFDEQWQRLKRYANQKGVSICGDMPIFVAHESADVWVNQPLFSLDEVGHPSVVAGVPPDCFSKTGQRWGNPLYRWDVSEASGHRWWTARFAGALRQFDLMRVDHFRGFEAYWEVPASEKTAVNGTWKPGPGRGPFDAAKEKLGELAIIAEDLGLITEEVHALREALDFPGMRVFQFGFDTVEDDFHRPNQFPKHSVAYTGTHDNDTLMGWMKRRTVDPATDPITPYLQSGQPVHLQLIQAVLNSASDTAIVPMQDVLGLDNSARMNIPGKARGNWTWRVTTDQLTNELASQLRAMSESSGRLP